MKFCFWSLSNVAVVFLLVAVGAAQSGDWASVQALAQGEQIKVALQNGGTIHGKFQSASDTGLVIAAGAGQQTPSRENVRSISTKHHSHRGRHALIGAAIGAGTGLGIGASIDNDCTKTSFVCTGNRGKAILTPAFAVIGAAIGAALPAGGWQKVYVK
jgi:hypothetical protein